MLRGRRLRIRRRKRKGRRNLREKDWRNREGRNVRKS
jgi:hypothetical protein